MCAGCSTDWRCAGRPGTTPRASTIVWTATTALLAALLVFENLSAPLPTSDMRIPAIYDQIAAQPGDFAVLDLPLGWRNGFSVFGKQDVIIMSGQCLLATK